MKLAVLAAGCRTSVGRDLAETAASIDARLRRFRRAPFVDLDGEPFLVAPVLALSHELSAEARVQLLLRAATEDLARHLNVSTLGRVGAIIVVETFAPDGWDTTSELAPTLAQLSVMDGGRLRAAQKLWNELPRALSLPAPVAAGGAMIGDSGTVIQALQTADAWLSVGVIDTCFIGGVSSQCDASTLAWLDRREVTRARRRDFGTIPGEACGLMVLGSAAQSSRMVVSAAHVEWSEVDPQSSAEALARSIEATLQAETAPSVVMLDTVGLPGQAESWAMASMRTLGRRGVAPRLLEPGVSLGDIGAATVPVYLGLLSHELAEPTLVAVSGGLQGNRGALLIKPGARMEAAT